MHTGKTIQKAVHEALRTRESTEGEGALAFLRRQWARGMGHLPSGCAQELFELGWEAASAGRPEFLADLWDLMNQQYDQGSDPFRQEDWSALAEVFQAWDEELDIDLLSYLMVLVVEKDGLGL